MKSTIRIEGGTYTSLKSALKYVRRGRAIILNRDGEDILVFTREINFFNQPEVGDCVDGKFTWLVADSGGSSLMKQYTGISGGTRVLQASHGN